MVDCLVRDWIMCPVVGGWWRDTAAISSCRTTTHAKCLIKYLNHLSSSIVCLLQVSASLRLSRGSIIQDLCSASHCNLAQPHKVAAPMEHHNVPNCASICSSLQCLLRTYAALQPVHIMEHKHVFFCILVRPYFGVVANRLLLRWFIALNDSYRAARLMIHACTLHSICMWCSLYYCSPSMPKCAATTAQE